MRVLSFVSATVSPDIEWTEATWNPTTGCDG